MDRGDLGDGLELGIRTEGPVHGDGLAGRVMGEGEGGLAAQGVPELVGSIDLAQTFLEDKVKWVPRPEWKDETVHNTLTGENSANYLFRTIEAAAAGPLEISLGRDDAIRVWLNGKQVLAQKVMGGAAPDQDKVKLALKAGRNELLMKIVNGGGPSGFFFKALPTGPPEVPCSGAALQVLLRYLR